MRTAVDYFGLMAYLWVMSGGMPDGHLLSPAEQRPGKALSRKRRRLRVIQGPKTSRPSAGAVVASEEGAAA